MSRDSYTPQQRILHERETRRRQAHIEQMSAPSYLSAHSSDAWLIAALALIVAVVIFAKI